MSKPSKRPLLRAARCVAVINCLGLMTSAAAEDSITPFIGIAYNSDDNVLGLSDESQYQRLIGRADGSDTARTAKGGVNVDYSISRQRFELATELSRTRYAYFKALDYDGRNVKANWNWVVGNTLSGLLTASNVRSLSRLSNFQSVERNLRTENQIFANGTWMLTPSWRLRASAGSYELKYDLESQRFSDIRENSVESGFAYVAKSGSNFGMLLRRLDGKYPGRSPLTGQNEEYRQNETKANVDWKTSGKTRMQAQLGWTSRDSVGAHPHAFSGPTARVTVDWTPSGKTLLNASAWKDVSAVDDVLASYSVNRGITLSPTWSLSEKVVLRGEWRYEKRDFQGSPAPLFDTDRNTSVSLMYAFTRSTTLQASLFRFVRDGNAYGNGYTRRGASLVAQYTFTGLH